MKTKLIYLVLLLVLIFPTYRFFLSEKMYTFNDETQIVNLYHYFKTIDLKQFPPRWAADMHFEYGSPFPSFNYQLPYYLGYLCHLAHLPLTTIFKLLMAFSIITGAVGMFLAGEVMTGSNLFALFAAVLYTYTPYQSIDHFVRGSLGEVFALALFPWIYLSAWSLSKKTKPSKIWLLGLPLALLILSHQPAALITIPFLALIFLPPAIIARDFRQVTAFLKALVLGFLLSAYYWIPVIFEKKFIGGSGPFNYHGQFPFFWQLIYSRWTYSGANPFSTDTFSFQIGIINLAILLVAIIYSVSGFVKKQKKTPELWLFRFTLIATFIAIFLMNIRSNFIWQSFTLLQAIQFPWRLLMFTTWFTPFLFLLMVSKFPPSLTKPITVILLIATIAINIGYFHPGMITDRSDRYYERIFLTRAVLSQDEKFSKDYLNFAEDYAPIPVGAVRPKNLPSAKLTSLFKSTEIQIVDTNPLAYRAQVKNKVTETLTFHTFYYPGWTVEINGNVADIKTNEIGAITFTLPPGSREVLIAFHETPLRLISNIISVTTIIIACLYLPYYLRRSYAPATT